MTISSWLNFGRPAPPGRWSVAGRIFWAPPYYSQREVFASPLSAFFIDLLVIWLCCNRVRCLHSICRLQSGVFGDVERWLRVVHVRSADNVWSHHQRWPVPLLRQCRFLPLISIFLFLHSCGNTKYFYAVQNRINRLQVMQVARGGPCPHFYMLRIAKTLAPAQFADFVYIIMFFFSTLVLIVSNFIVACAFVTCY